MARYIYFTSEQKEQAASVDLEGFLLRQGEQLIKSGREKRLASDHSVTICGCEWFDHATNEGGRAVSFVQKFYGKSYVEAMTMLLGSSVESAYPQAKKQVTTPQKPFIPPVPNANMHRVFAYLLKTRGLDAGLISSFAHRHLIYEDAAHHNAVFIGTDGNGCPRHAHLRSTNSHGKPFRLNVEASDPRYSFHHTGTDGSLYVFEAPIDMLSFLTLYPDNWQQHSYIAANGVYEKAVIQALQTHPDLQEIVLCTDNDEGGIDAAYRFRDVLREHGYENVKRFAPPLKDWNEVLKFQHGAEYLPAVPHRRLDTYQAVAGSLQAYRFVPETAAALLWQGVQNQKYPTLAGFALAGSVFFLQQAGCNISFRNLRSKLQAEYKPYADKAKHDVRLRHFQNAVKSVQNELRRHARTREQFVQAAKQLYDLAQTAVGLAVDEALTQEQSEELTEAPDMAYG